MLKIDIQRFAAQRERLRNIMNKYSLKRKMVASLLSLPYYTVSNWCDGRAFFRPETEFMLLHKIKENLTQYTESIDIELERFNHE
jgi:hypothetical protein